VNPLDNADYVALLTGSVRLVLPEAALVGTACALFLLAAFGVGRSLAFVVTLLGIGGAAAVALLFPEQPLAAEQLSLAVIDPSPAAAFVRWLALVSAAVFAFIGWADTRKETAGEYFACLLVVIAGLSLVARANDLVSLFLALELISVPTYVLLYLPSRSAAGQEATMKYFMLSVLSSGVLLFGFSYLYGLTGSLNLPVITGTLTAAAKTGTVSPMALVAMVLVIAGLGFRLAAVPFHFYAPDVYEGAPTGVVGQLAFIPKVAGFVALARLLGLFHAPITELPFDTARTLIPLTLWVIAAVSMCLGNLMALLQDNLKRLFAYSGIAHGGYMLIGILVACSVPDARAAAPDRVVNTGMDSLLFYLVAYGLMTVGALAILSHLAFGDKPVETVDDLAGLGRTHPIAAAALAVCFFSLIGLPLTAGFYGKFKLFFDAFAAPTDTPMKNLYRVLVVLGAVNAAVAAVYYLRVIGVLYLRSPLKPAEPTRGYPALVAGVACAVATLAIGVFPQPLMDAARKATTAPTAPVQAVADGR